MSSAIKTMDFGVCSDGTIPRLFILDNGSMRVGISEYGAIICSAIVPDVSSGEIDLLLGSSTLAGLCARHPYMGSTVGRFANRIAGARFTLDGIEYVLAANNGKNSLHGGLKGFDRCLWQAEPGEESGEACVRMSLCSHDGDQGFPGRLDVSAVFTLRADNTLALRYEAVSDAATPVNITNHAYFNLRGEGNGTIVDHELELYASAYVAVGDSLIPVPGSPALVEGTPFDFRKRKAMGRDLAAVGGYDHCYVIDGWDGSLRKVASVLEPESGRTLEAYSDMPGLQFYSGNFIGDVRGKRGSVYDKHSGFCLEAEYFPDSPNRPDFPSCILRPGKAYRHSIEYRFGF
ncbi:MAG: aldose epimerase family protein [Spirochaetia bacterium]|nr:aldose epimerase family protein [Spirochaetia bacterium]